MSDTAGVIAPPPVLYGAALAGGLVADRTIAHVPWLPEPARLPVGLALAGAGVGLVVGAARALARGGTPASPYEPTRAVVVSGPYRRTRNPIYLGMSLIVAAGAALANAAAPLAALALVTPVVRYGVIGREEAYLAERLGAPYAEYRARVRRWL